MADVVGEVLASWPDLYAVLGVTPDVAPDALRRAFKKRALYVHPDKNGSSQRATEAFKHVQAASRILSDASLRSLYDGAGGGQPGLDAVGKHESGGDGPSLKQFLAFIGTALGRRPADGWRMRSTARAAALSLGVVVAVGFAMWGSQVGTAGRWSVVPDSTNGLVHLVALGQAKVYVAANAPPPAAGSTATATATLCKARRLHCGAAALRGVACDVPAFCAGR